jgi:hypothetical protein
MIGPFAIDMNETTAQALVSKTQFLDHPQRRRVFWPNTDLHPMETLFKKQIISG